ncbi:hypothetical protein A4A49_52440 [Nicotiana attenuata]|uniref:RING-type E3 ubiquitin transferase n=1 Tax=Nicotiana attenuata TaxID=49451 RepID=A0A1J6IEP2_NICAT|nr:hypothetical protein A4A49_52440 [Nicotiana attenuata]
MNNTINSSTPVEIQFSSKTIHRWVGTDRNGTQKVVPYQEEEKLEEAFSLWLSYEELMMCVKSQEKYTEIIVSEVTNNWPTISSLDFQENPEYRFIECNKEIIRASAALLLYRYHVCDRTRFQPASLSLIDSLKKPRIKSDCVICLGDLPVGIQVVRTPCSHYFHLRCLWTWLERRGSCPICRYEMSVQ